MDDLYAKLGPATKLLSMVHVNALGTIQRAEIQECSSEALLLLDGAQATPHGPVDVQALGCDFYVFSGLKVYGPRYRRALRPFAYP